MTGSEGSFKRKNSIWRLVILLILILVPGLSGCSPAGMPVDGGRSAENHGNGDKWHDRYEIVTHALGTSGAEPYNCLEGFEWSYGRGQKVFECDFALTADNRLVLAHSLADSGSDEKGSGSDLKEDDGIPDYREFMSTPIEGGYTPLSLEDMLDLMEEHGDIYLVTDFKAEDSTETLSQMELMCSVIDEQGRSELYPRIIVQFYQEDELPKIKEMADFGGYIFSLYKRGFDKSDEEFESIASFCRDNGVDVIVMKKGKWRSGFTPLARKYGVKVYPHTIYSAWQEELMQRSGADGAYCDGVSTAEAEELRRICSHWFDSSEDMAGAASVAEAEELYAAGERAIYVDPLTAGDADKAAAFLKEHADAWLGYDYDEAVSAALADSVRQLASDKEASDINAMDAAAGSEAADAILARSVVFTGKFSIFNKGLKKHMLWCDVVYLSEAENDYEFDRCLDKALEKGIACVALDKALWKPEYEEVADHYDVHVWLR